MIREFEQVALRIDLPHKGLVVGDVGTVIDISGSSISLEFFNFAGETLTTALVSADDVRPLRADEVLHTRSVKA